MNTEHCYRLFRAGFTDGMVKIFEKEAWALVRQIKASEKNRFAGLKFAVGLSLADAQYRCLHGDFKSDSVCFVLVKDMAKNAGVPTAVALTLMNQATREVMKETYTRIFAKAGMKF